MGQFGAQQVGELEVDPPLDRVELYRRHLQGAVRPRARVKRVGSISLGIMADGTREG